LGDHFGGRPSALSGHSFELPDGFELQEEALVGVFDLGVLGSRSCQRSAHFGKLSIYRCGSRFPSCGEFLKAIGGCACPRGLQPDEL
jgi:hypothetical protein